MDHSTTADAKKTLRKRVLQAVRSMTREQHQLCGQRVTERLSSFVSSSGIRRIAAYLPMVHELPIDAWLEACYREGIEILVPGSGELGQPLRWWIWTPETALHLDRYNIRVPADEHVVQWMNGSIVEWLGERGMVLVPGVAFDQRGGRLGYGGGFYDRLLSELANERDREGENVPAVYITAAAFEMQVVTEIPMEPHDQRVDWLFTESMDIHCKNS